MPAVAAIKRIAQHDRFPQKDKYITRLDVDVARQSSINTIAYRLETDEQRVRVVFLNFPQSDKKID